MAVVAFANPIVANYNAGDTSVDDQGFAVVVVGSGNSRVWSRSSADGAIISPGVVITPFVPTITGAPIGTGAAEVMPDDFVILKFGSFAIITGSMSTFWIDAPVTFGIPAGTFTKMYPPIAGGINPGVNPSASSDFRTEVIDNDTFKVDRNDSIDGDSPVTIVVLGTSL